MIGCGDALESVVSLREAKNSLRHSLLALSFLELEGEEEEEGRSLRWRKFGNSSLVLSLSG